MSVPIIRPLVKNDLISFKIEKVRYSIKGVAVELDQKTIAVAGVILSPRSTAFSDMKDEMRDYPVMIMKTARELSKILNTMHDAVYATANPNEPNSKRCLERIGFKLINDRLFKWVPHQVG